MKLKITARPTAGRKFDTRIVDVETGQELNDVLYCHIKLDSVNGGCPMVELGLTDVAVDVIADNIKMAPFNMTGYWVEDDTI